MTAATDPPAEPPSHDASEVRVHRYPTGLRWAGSTAAGYAAYDRTHTVWTEPDGPALTLSGDPAFGGRAELLNPEQLLVLAASSCQLLSFISLAARARIEVVAYEDTALGEMPERGSTPASIETIVLRPTIEIRGDVHRDKVLRLVRLAHEECYIANSLRTEVTVEPTLVFLDQ
jgi:organic hydroperoxide reductase OsmC/OhrA